MTSELIKLLSSICVHAHERHGITLLAPRSFEFAAGPRILAVGQPVSQADDSIRHAIIEQPRKTEYDEPHWEMLLLKDPGQFREGREVLGKPFPESDPSAFRIHISWHDRQSPAPSGSFRQMRCVWAERRLPELTEDAVNQIVDELITDIKKRI